MTDSTQQDMDALEASMYNKNWKMCDIKSFTYNEKPHPNMRLKVSGLSSCSFDRDVKPRIKSLMLLDSNIRRFSSSFVMKDGFTRFERNSKGELVGTEKNPDIFTTKDRSFTDWVETSKGLFGFGAWARFTLSRAFYDIDVPKWEVDYKVTLGHVRSGSVIYLAEAYTPNDKTLLWTNCYGVVMVDMKTRKPTRLPEAFVNKYQGKGCLDKPVVLRPFSKPAKTFQLNLTVRWFDTDDYGHTNWSSYMTWAEDALRAAMLPKNAAARGPRGALSAITRDYLTRGLSKFEISYFRECMEGDEIQVHLWQEEAGPEEHVFFSITKDGEEINQGQLWYHLDE